ncbi:hypothetical protein F7725_006404 [Dissostichus mawsoni]|uniref:Serpin domain-containing protein n=1 Tax=Dissostichus mawsoni TaxID=36200 RepID=A0A7J5XTX0_DISMA|nr:hypothetical protein F7725_006404 [Dissostichus mawsoni]
MKLCLLLLLLCLCCLGLTQELSTVPPDVPEVEEKETEEEQVSCTGSQAFSPESRRAIGGAIERLGARNETEKLLLESLHASELPCFHHTLGALVPHFRNTSLEVAARMYLRPGFEMKLSFVEDSLARYQSSPVPLVSVEEVNQWVENATNGQINDFMESIPHSVVLMLINAVYFKGKPPHQRAWCMADTVCPQVTSKGAFYLDNSNSVSVDMMKSPQYPLRLLNDQQLEAQVTTGADSEALLPCAQTVSPSKEHQFLIVMPLSGKGNVSSTASQTEHLRPLQTVTAGENHAGLGSLFSGPNLSGITSDPLRVTGVRHASTLELSEEGVEASATTAVTTMRSISLFSANSPFFFALMGAATSDFGYNLFRALAVREASTNIFLSPISVSAALTQLSLGGSERAERMLFRALRYNTLQDPQLHVTLKDLLASVRTPGKGLSTAARLYLSRRIRPKQEFFALVEQQYGVRPKTLAGGPKDVSEINTWVSQETGGKVQLLLAKPLPRNAGVHTVSASYFKGKWVTRFGQSGVMANFQVDGAAPVRVPMMQQDNYPVKIGADSDLSCTESLTAEFVQDLSMTLIPAEATKLGSVNHKVAMETAPEGNQYPRSGAPGHLTYRVDRPFLFLIRDEASGALLFIGREKLEKKKKMFGSFRTTI